MRTEEQSLWKRGGGGAGCCNGGRVWKQKLGGALKRGTGGAEGWERQR